MVASAEDEADQEETERRYIFCIPRAQEKESRKRGYKSKAAEETSRFPRRMKTYRCRFLLYYILPLSQNPNKRTPIYNGVLIIESPSHVSTCTTFATKSAVTRRDL